MKRSNLKVSTQLAVGFGMATLLGVVIATLGAFQARGLAGALDHIAAERIPQMSRIQTMQDNFNNTGRAMRTIVINDDPMFRAAEKENLARVRAARAGEQGRGFAVVAGEVRSLAQRSAEAAKEIKTLITQSVEQVEQGSTLVDQAGHSMGEIVAAIQRVADIVGEISAASAEQSTGVGQVETAIGQMDQATQQNAALVEESAAAAASLRGQAQALVEAMAIFKVAGAHQAAPAAVAQAVVAKAAAAAPKPVAKAEAIAPVAPAAPKKAEPVAAAAGGASDEWESF